MNPNDFLNKTVEYRLLDVMNIMRNLNDAIDEEDIAKRKQKVNSIKGVLVNKIQNGVKLG